MERKNITPSTSKYFKSKKNMAEYNFDINIENN